MEHKIKDAFQGIKAEDELKAQTKAFVYEEMAKKSRPRRFFQRKLVYALSLSFILLLAVAGGHHLYFTTTAIISMDINPSIELDVNRFNKVIGVTGYNDDGVDLAQSLDVLYLNYDQAIDEVIQSEKVAECLANNEFLSIAVVQMDEEQGEAILQYVSSCTANHANAHCYGVNAEDVAEAHSYGLSYGKYTTYLELKDCMDITPEEVAGMTMRELRDLLMKVSSEDIVLPGHQHQGSGNGFGHGHGDNSNRQNNWQ